jgi:hypothetical protein
MGAASAGRSVAQQLGQAAGAGHAVLDNDDPQFGHE